MLDSNEGLYLLNGATGGPARTRTQRERTTERKRQRGEIACAECRRLKLKCDKKIPCSSCTRRQCQSICPNGVMATTQATRLEKLQRSVTLMSRRIRLLENALKADHAALSSDPHPLLAEELLEIKKGNPKDLSDQEDFEDDPPDSNDGLTDTLGLLSFNEGETRFVGASGSEQMILMTEAKVEELTPELGGISPAAFPTFVSDAASAWPFTPSLGSISEIQAQIEAQLPCYERAKELCDVFMNAFCWWVRPVTQEQLYEELLPMVYNLFGQDVDPAAQAQSIDGTTKRKADVHDLSLLFIILACGAHTDLKLPFQNEETKRYCQLARASLALKSVFDTASLSAVQSIALLAQLDVLLGKDNALESSWRLMCLALSLAMSIGLHRDPAGWNLGPKLVHRRRQAFWSIYLIALWKALSCGKPITISIDTIDCEYPEDIEVVKIPDGTTLPSMWRLFHIFTKDILATLAERVCAARPPKYAEILDLDKRLTEHDGRVAKIMEVCLGLIPKEALESADGGMRMKLASHGLMSALAMTYTHRNYFARALLDYPKNPLDSPYAKSFVACFGCAMHILQKTRENFRRDPEMTLRCWPIWEHSIAATIIIGFVACQCAGSEEALAALKEIDLAVGVFQDASVHPFVKHGLPILCRVREKALRAANSQSQPDASAPNDDFDLRIFKGMTRVVVEGKSAKNSPEPGRSDSSPRSSPSISPPMKGSPNPPATGVAPTPSTSRLSWSMPNANAGQNLEYANVPEALPSLPPNPQQQHSPMVQQSNLRNATLSPYGYGPPVNNTHNTDPSFNSPFIPQYLTGWSSVIPNFAGFGSGAGEYMTMESMVTDRGVSHAAEQSLDINLAALLPSFGATSSESHLPSAAGQPQSTLPPQPMSVPYTSNQQYSFQNQLGFDDTLQSILTS